MAIQNTSPLGGYKDAKNHPGSGLPDGGVPVDATAAGNGHATLPTSKVVTGKRGQ